MEAIGPAILALALAMVTARMIHTSTPATAFSAEVLMSESFPRADRSLTPRVEP
jgi:hypothetical protein